MKRILHLSYFLSDSTPLYGKSIGIKINKEKSMIKGDNCNTTLITLPSHAGTHIDAPYHFDPSGKTISDYPAYFWIFNDVEIIDISNRVNDSQMIEPGMLRELYNHNVDLLIIKTGYGKFRGTDQYTLTPPGISSAVANWIREKYCSVRCLGMDLISVSSYSNREKGRKAHQAFLRPEEGEPILLIEDMKLDSVGPLEKVIVSPLLIDSSDGAPCTVLGIAK